VKTNAAEMLKQINDTHNPIVITQNGEARAVLIDPQSFQEMRDALGILKLISQGEQDARSGRTDSHEDVMQSVRTQIMRATPTDQD
jgi:prevent-host-death family protein